MPVNPGKDEVVLNTSPDACPSACTDCGAPLCLRKQVLNLALGNVEKMWCLNCLAAENKKTPTDVLTGVKSYVLSRECFSKEWKKYKTVEYCPDPDGCLPSVCFDLSKCVDS